MASTADSACPVARTMAVIGGRWTVLMVRDVLAHGSRRFQDLKDSLSGIAPNTLSDQLKLLESHGVVERFFYEQHPSRAAYRLKEKGRALRPIIGAMKTWGETHINTVPPPRQPQRSIR